MKFRIHVTNSSSNSADDTHFKFISDDLKTQVEARFSVDNFGQVWLQLFKGHQTWCELEYGSEEFQEANTYTDPAGKVYARVDHLHTFGITPDELEQFRQLICQDLNMTYDNPYETASDATPKESTSDIMPKNHVSEDAATQGDTALKSEDLQGKQPPTWGQVLAAQQALNKMFNAPHDTVISAQLIDVLKKHILQIKERMINQLKSGQSPCITISQSHSSAAWKDLRINKWANTSFNAEVPFYPLWKSILVDWAHEQQLALTFKIEGSSRLSNTEVSIKASPLNRVPVNEMSVEELLNIIASAHPTIMRA